MSQIEFDDAFSAWIKTNAEAQRVVETATGDETGRDRLAVLRAEWHLANTASKAFTFARDNVGDLLDWIEALYNRIDGRDDVIRIGHGLNLTVRAAPPDPESETP